MGDSNRESHAEEFLKLVSDAADQSYLHEGHDYAFVKQGTDDAELLLKIRKVHAGVTKYVSDYNLTSVDLLDDESDYKSRFSDMEGKQYVTDSSKRHRELARCIAFSVEELEQMADFNINSF